MSMHDSQICIYRHNRAQSLTYSLTQAVTYTHTRLQAYVACTNAFYYRCVCTCVRKREVSAHADVFVDA